MSDETAVEEKSEFESAIASMTPEQFATISGVVQGEAARRDDPMKRIGSMTDHELSQFKDKIGL